MEVAISLPIRTWAALDVALGFFRAAPQPLADSKLTRHCRRLHRLLHHAGIRGRYALVGVAGTGKTLLRLHVNSRPPLRQPWLLHLPRRAARILAEACWTILRVQTDSELGPLLDYEAEELQAARAFLSELRRQWPGLPRVLSKPGGPQPVAWDDRFEEYLFASPVAERVHRHYLLAGAGTN